MVSLDDFEPLAQRLIAKPAYDYFAGGVEDEVTLGENRTAFQRIRLRPRVMVDVGQRDLTTTVLGHRVSMPLLLSPTGHQKMAHPDAELATARAAHAAGTIATFGCAAHYGIEEITAVSPGPIWFQLYAYDSRPVTERIIRRAEDAGCQALVITVDGSYASRRWRNLRNQFALPPGVEVRNLVGVGMRDDLLRDDLSGYPAFLSSLRTLNLTWADLAWIRALTSLPILLKGILTVDDALLAVEHGVDGIIVSNHGARQIDTTCATIEVLPAIAEAVGGRIEVLVDGGIRRGTDVLKALALGAKAAMIGRPYVWGLAVGGEAGVRQVLELLRTEIDNALAQLGRPSVASIDRSLVLLPGETPH